MRLAFAAVGIGGVLLLVASSTTTALAASGNQAPEVPSAPSAVPAKDGTLDMSVSNPEEVAKQERLESYAAPLMGLLEAADNFGGFAYDLDAYAFDMWWRGDVPKNVQDVLDNFGDVKVRLHEAKYTAQELGAAANKVAQYPSDQFDVITATLENRDRPTPVYGIEIEVDVHGAMPNTAIAAELTEVAGLPVTVNQDLASIPAIGRLPRT